VVGSLVVPATAAYTYNKHTQRVSVHGTTTQYHARTRPRNKAPTLAPQHALTHNGSQGQTDTHEANPAPPHPRPPP
jgi:hypothetical protein